MMDDEEMLEMQLQALEAEATQFDTYEDYLDHQIQPLDLYFLEDEDMARQLVELGFRGTSAETMKREEFEGKKQQLEDLQRQISKKAKKTLAHAGRDLSDAPFLKALADREELVRSGKLTTIIFIRDVNHKGQEISGYIDFGHRLKTENFELYFDHKKKLLPKPSDLSYYNWETQTSTSNHSQNFQVIADNYEGLLFKNKRDRKVINVDPKAKPGDNSQRVEIRDTRAEKYIQVVIYDHVTRRKN